LLVQVPALWKLGWRPRISLDVKDEKVREVFVLMGRGGVGPTSVQVNISSTAILPATWETGGGLAQLCIPLHAVSNGIFGVAIAWRALPEFLRATANRPRRHGGAAPRPSGRACRWRACLVRSRAMGLAVLGEPLIGVSGEHGRFTAADTAATARLLAYSVGWRGMRPSRCCSRRLLALK